MIPALIVLALVFGFVLWLITRPWVPLAAAVRSLLVLITIVAFLLYAFLVTFGVLPAPTLAG